MKRPSQRQTKNHSNIYTLTQAQSYENIMANVGIVDEQNKKLIAIADSIMKTSFLKPQEKTPAIILQFQEDIKLSFNALIQSIKEFFINIDTKIQNIGQILEPKLNIPQKYTKNSSSSSSLASQNDRYDMLIKRMMALEQNLKQTQNNQAKLIQIIENMNRKNGIFDEQPTMTRSKDKLRLFSQQNVKQSQNSFRLFSINSHPHLNTHHNNAKSPLLKYNMIESSLQDSILHPSSSEDRYNQPLPQLHKNIPKQQSQPFLQPYFCMPKNDNSISKNIYMGNNNQHLQHSNRIHRLSNLMRNLKAQ